MPDFICFQPTEEEWPVLLKMMHDQGLSEEALIRQALRLYNIHLVRLSAGETCHYSGDAERMARFTGNVSEE